jgi:hypothetical protein
VRFQSCGSCAGWVKAGWVGLPGSMGSGTKYAALETRAFLFLAGIAGDSVNPRDRLSPTRAQPFAFVIRTIHVKMSTRRYAQAARPTLPAQEVHSR